MFFLPQHFFDHTEQHRTIILRGCSVVESCLYQELMTDSAYTTEFEIIHIVSGMLSIEQNKQVHHIQAGGTAIVRKGTYFDFTKKSTADAPNYQSILFFLKQDFINEFLRKQYQHSHVQKTHDGASNIAALKTIICLPQHPLLQGFMRSLMPYFGSALEGNHELLRIKTLEFLLNLQVLFPATLSVFSEAPTLAKDDLVRVMEETFHKNLPIEEFAVLSGRSLSTFKRDFAEIYATTPAQWLKERRLNYAKKLLAQDKYNVSEACYEAGFENVSHFSASFKKYFGYSPTHLKLTSSQQSFER